MYTTIPLRDQPMPDVTVVADTATSHIINLLARVVAARNPLITAPPADSIVWKKAGDHSAAAELMATLNRAVVDPFFLKVRAGETMSSTMNASADAPWLIAAVNMGLATMVQFGRSYARGVPELWESLKALADEGSTSMSSLPVTALSLEDLLDKDPIRVPFARAALTLAYESIATSGAFDKLTPPDATTEKAPYTTLQRGLLLAALLRVLSIQTVLLRIRPLLRYLGMEQSKVRLREMMMPTSVEYWESIISRVLAMPVHPWIARAEEPTLPTPRATPWGTSTPSILLERGYLSLPWTGGNEPTTDQRAKYADAMRDKLDPVILLESLQPLLKAMHKLMLDLDVDGRFAKVASMLRFTSPRGPVPIPLWGAAFRPVHTDGLYSTEAVSDLVALSYQPHLPAQGNKGTPWVGDELLVNYTGKSRLDGDGTVWAGYGASFSVAPLDVVVEESFYSSRFSPSILRFKGEDWMGDMGAVFIPATPPGVASLIGKSETELLRMVKKNPSQWQHIFTLEGDTLKPNRPDQELFYSTRTQMPWLTSIELPRRGVPSMMIAMRRGLPETMVETRSRLLRDAMVPQPTIPLDAAVTRLVTEALVFPLTGVK